MPGRGAIAEEVPVRSAEKLSTRGHGPFVSAKGQLPKVHGETLACGFGSCLFQGPERDKPTFGVFWFQSRKALSLGLRKDALSNLCDLSRPVDMFDIHAYRRCIRYAHHHHSRGMGNIEIRGWNWRDHMRSIVFISTEPPSMRGGIIPIRQGLAQ